LHLPDAPNVQILLKALHAAIESPERSLHFTSEDHLQIEETYKQSPSLNDYLQFFESV